MIYIRFGGVIKHTGAEKVQDSDSRIKLRKSAVPMECAAFWRLRQ